MHNPLNLNPGGALGSTEMYNGSWPCVILDGTASFADWATGIAATAETMQNGHPAMIAALKANNPTNFFIAIAGGQQGSWATDPNYANEVETIYNEMMAA